LSESETHVPLIWMPQEEFEALQAVFSLSAKVDWAAYDRAKAYILTPIAAPPLEVVEHKDETTQSL